MKCQHPNCIETQSLVSCFFPDNQTLDANAYYCTNHTFKHGFCWSCGQFWGGVESFENPVCHGLIEGLCEDCTHEMRGDFGNYDEEEIDEEHDPYCYWG